MLSATEKHSRLAVLGTVIFYMVVAISMTLLNKSVLSSTPMPVFLLFCQSSIAVCLLGVENALGPFKTPKFDINIARELVPLTFVNVLGLIFNNACLQYVDASFHQVARGLVLPFTIIVTIIVLHHYPSPLALMAALVVTFGFFSGVLFDPNHASSAASASVAGSAKHSSLGIAFGAMSSVSSACHAVLIKRGLQTVSNSPIGLSYYNNILSTIALIPLLIVSGELPGVLKLIRSPEAATFYQGAGLTGIFGFLISLASFMSIKVTSPVTHMISSAARGVLQTILAVYIFGDVMSHGRIISIFLIVSGSMLYVYAKNEDAKRSSSSTSSSIPLSAQDYDQTSDPKALESGDLHAIHRDKEDREGYR
ncbi:hypothetical protein IAR55_002211 [Kwoniella newhampshirensis]|uniref:Sugar phosphate transporter domain-containing protein n=1 Tax=Kwoniella newhampshirensis TaxID=1651941 RepID=A0AAW0Z0Z7_9TREE